MVYQSQCLCMCEDPVHRTRAFMCCVECGWSLAIWWIRLINGGCLIVKTIIRNGSGLYAGHVECINSHCCRFLQLNGGKNESSLKPAGSTFCGDGDCLRWPLHIRTHAHACHILVSTTMCYCLASQRVVAGDVGQHSFFVLYCARMRSKHSRLAFIFQTHKRKTYVYNFIFLFPCDHFTFWTHFAPASWRPSRLAGACRLSTPLHRSIEYIFYVAVGSWLLIYVVPSQHIKRILAFRNVHRNDGRAVVRVGTR